jgi:uridine phosphorylase
MGIAMEEYVAFGVRQFISVGIAGSLQPYLHTADIVICDEAIRGEGTSGHYLPPSRLVEADSALANGIHSVFTGKGVQFSKGTSWTTDAPYRETHREVDCYMKEGILTVDMEAAALFAVAKSLGARAAAVFIIADRLLPEGWEPPSQTASIEKSMDKVLDALIPWLANMDKIAEGTR